MRFFLKRLEALPRGLDAPPLSWSSAFWWHKIMPQQRHNWRLLGRLYDLVMLSGTFRVRNLNSGLSSAT